MAISRLSLVIMKIYIIFKTLRDFVASMFLIKMLECVRDLEEKRFYRFSRKCQKQKKERRRKNRLPNSLKLAHRQTLSKHFEHHDIPCNVFFVDLRKLCNVISSLLKTCSTESRDRKKSQ